MPNDFSSNPWIIDTAAATVLTNEPLKVKSVRWVAEGAAAGNNAVVQDKNGKVKAEFTATGANYTDDYLVEPTDFWDGLIVPTLDAGKLYLLLA